MKKHERIQQILTRIAANKTGTVLSTRALAEEFAVSEITLRRDLQELSQSGLIQRRHGGVLKAGPQSNGIKYAGIVVVSFQGKYSHPFYNELLEGADGELGRLGYIPAFVKTFVEVNTREQITELVQLHPIGGLLVLGELDGETCRLWQGVTPHIVAAPSVISLDVTCITYDGYGAMRRLLDHLVGLGHRRIGLIIGQSNAMRVDDRMRGYLAGVAEHHLDDDAELVCSMVHPLERLPAKIGREGAEQLMRLPHPPGAIMCASDAIALGAMQWLQANGYNIPKDVAVTGFDNIQDAHLAYPPLTTVHLHKRLMGRLAAEQLHRCIERPDDPPLTVLTPTSLVVRSSCGA
jgi:LacI family transcriptional regulator